MTCMAKTVQQAGATTKIAVQFNNLSGNGNLTILMTNAESDAYILETEYTITVVAVV